MTSSQSAHVAACTGLRLSFVCEGTESTTWAQLVEMWRAADQMPEYVAGWTYDHFYPWTGNPDGACFEGWIALAGLLGATERLRGGLMVSCTAYRHPAVLANMIATLDITSGGRLEIGLGAGWLASEAEAYGIDLLEPGPRSARFAEAVEIILGLLQNERTTFGGKYYTLSDARCEPKPVQRPHPPLCIGGGGEKRTLPLTAKWAQHWNLGKGSARSFARKRAILAECCAAIGRNVNDITCSTQVYWDPENPGLFQEALGEYVAAGMDLAVVVLREPYTPDMLLTVIDSAAPWFARVANQSEKGQEKAHAEI